MTWTKAFTWAVPVWIVTVATIGGLMQFTDFVTDVGKAEALKRLALLAIVALPLIAFLVRATNDDVVRFRAALLAKDGGGIDG